MTFDAEKFNTLGGQRKAGVSFGTFGYLSTDERSVVIASGYFNALRATLQVNDIIQVLDKTVSPSAQYSVCITAAPAANTYQNVAVAEVPIPALGLRPVVVSNVDANYAVAENDDIILAEGTIAITLLAVAIAVQKVLTIVNVGDGDITITGVINSESSYVLTAKYEGVTIFPSTAGAEWVIINKH
jgi:hypothetical protein